MTRIRDLQEKWKKEPDYRKAYEELGPAFELARALIQARTHAGLTQAQLARRMKTTQSVVARLEGGRVRPSTKTLERIATATGTRLRISFESDGVDGPCSPAWKCHMVVVLNATIERSRPRCKLPQWAWI